MGVKERSGGTLLHRAATCRSRAPVEALLAAGADVGATTKAGYTALHDGSKRGSAAVVRSLLSAGADLDAKTKDGATPLQEAGKHWKPAAAAVRALVQAGADVLAEDKYAVSALHYAVHSVAAVRDLLRAGADVAAATKSGETPLHRAATLASDIDHMRCEFFSVLGVLLDAGANSGAREELVQLPLHVAARNCPFPAAADLLSRASLDSGRDSCRGPPGGARVTLARTGRKRPPRDEINAKDKDFLTPLHCAVLSGHTRVVTNLIQRGADHAAVSKLGHTPLCIAAALGHGEIVDLLWGDHPAAAVTTPLHQVVQFGRLELLDKPQIRPFLETADGCVETALHVAARRADPPMVRALTDRGADVGRENEYGHTPLQVAMSWLDRRKADARATATGRLRRAGGYRPDVAVKLVAAGHVLRRQRGNAERAALPDRLVREVDD